MNNNIQYPLKRNAVLSAFGSKYGTKLLNWLDPCCPEFCESIVGCFTIPINQVVYGTGSGITSDANFTRRTSDGQFIVKANPSSSILNAIELGSITEFGNTSGVSLLNADSTNGINNIILVGDGTNIGYSSNITLFQTSDNSGQSTAMISAIDPIYGVLSTIQNINGTLRNTFVIDNSGVYISRNDSATSSTQAFQIDSTGIGYKPTSSIKINFPTTDGTVGQAIVTDGMGNLSFADAGGWSLTGNAATDPSVNFIGTTDGQPIVFKVNNQFAGFIGTGHNASFGVHSLNYPTSTGDHCVAFGQNALNGLTSGDGNSAFGYGSGNSVTTENGNTLLGNGANINPGVQNSIVLGVNTSADVSDKLYVADNITSVHLGHVTGYDTPGYALITDGTNQNFQPSVLSGATGSEPPTPYLGQFYFDSDLVKMKFWNGSVWAIITSTP